MLPVDPKTRGCTTKHDRLDILKLASRRGLIPLELLINNFPRVLVFYSRFLFFVQFTSHLSALIWRQFVDVLRSSIHLMVVKYELLPILRYLKSAFELIVIHDCLIKGIVVLGAIDWLFLQLLKKIVVSPLFAVLVFLILLVKGSVTLPMSIKTFAAKTNIVHFL